MTTSNRQSFFKLPFIFISVFGVIFFGLMLVFYFAQNLPDLSDQFLYKRMIFLFIKELFPLILFLMIAILCCYKFRFHYLVDSRLTVEMIGVIFALFYVGFHILNIFAIRIINEQFISSSRSSWIGKIDLFMLFKWRDVMTYLVSLFFLYLLFFLFGHENVIKRQPYKLEGLAASRIYAHTFSFLMLLLVSLFLVYIGYPYLLFPGILIDERYLILIFVFELLILMLYYFIFYFATRNCFKKFNSALQFLKMLVTVLIVFILLLIVPLFNLKDILILIFEYLAPENSITGVNNLFILIHFIFCFCSSRLSVKIMYH